MSVIETLTFRLGPHVDAAAFLDADKRVQAEFVYQQPGVVRRTTARGDNGEWIVLSLWRSAADADAAATLSTRDPAAAAFAACLEPSSGRTTRYAALD